MTDRAWNAGQRRGDRAARPRVRLGRRRHRQDVGADRAGGPAAAGGHAARPPAGDHVHRARGRRAEAADTRAAARAGHAGGRGRRSSRPGSRPSTASARGCCAPTRWRRASIPRSAVASDTEMRILQSEAFAAAAGAVRRGRTTRRGSTCWPATAATGCGGWWSELHGRLRGLGLALELVPHRRTRCGLARVRGGAGGGRRPGADRAAAGAVRRGLRGRQAAARPARLQRPRAARPRPAAGAAGQSSAAYRERFAEVMVDEFQDTNRLQVELVELVRGGDLFLVGDEFQSIYRFRRADVEVYREQRAEAGDEVIALDQNYRSRPPCARPGQRGLRPRVRRAATSDLVAAGEFEGDAPADGGRAAADRRPRLPRGRRRVAPGRGGAIAGRVAELVEAGGCAPGRSGAAVRGRHRRRHLRGRAARAGAADRARHRPRLLRPAGGGGPAGLPAAAAQPHRRPRRCCRCWRRRWWACRTTAWR